MLSGVELERNSILPCKDQISQPLGQRNTHRIILEVAMPEKSEKIFTTKDKVIQAAAYSLMIVGVLFLLGAIGMAVSGILVGGISSLMLSESLFSTAMVSLVAGVHLFTPSKDTPKIQSSLRFGPITVSI